VSLPVPPLFDRRLEARGLASLIFVGVGVGALTLAFPHSSRLDDAALAAVLVAGLFVGTWIWLRAGAASAWEIHGGLVVSTGLVAASNYFADGTGLFPVLFTWVGLYAFYFFAARVALAYIALIGLAYAVSLLATDQAGEAVRWLLAVGTPLGGGLLITRLREDMRAQSAGTAAGEARTRAIVDSAPDALVTLDREGTIVMWNPAAERLFGFTAEEAIGRFARDLIVRPADVESHLERIAQDFATPERELAANVREIELQRRDGSPVPVELIVKRVRAGGEDVITTFIHDLTDRIRRDEERLQLAREQAAREDAEQMAGIVHGLQLLIDAALANNRLDEMLAALLPRLCEVLHADAASILLADEDGGLVVRATTGAGGLEATRRLAPGEGTAGRVAADRDARLDPDPDPDELSDPALTEMGSVLSVPLAAGEAITGVIQVGVPAPRSFREEDLLVLSLAADRVALAIEHARIYEREHRIAETLQRSLLPERLPTLPGLDVAARYLPAAAEAEVGGDWYDVVPIHSGCVGLVMGDVAGKGLAAASMVGRLRSAVRAYALEGHEPAGVVERLNQLVFSETDDGNMATLVYVVIDPGEGIVRWVNAGHLPPLLLGQSEPTFLDGPGSVPLGVMPYPGYGAREAELPEDATVLLYTDGLVERPGEILDAGLERLGAAATGAGAPDELCERVLDRLVPPGGTADDVALLALHYPRLSDHFHVHLPADPGELAAMRALLRRWLVRADGREDEISEILTAAGEATSNAIEHAGGSGGGVDVVGELAAGGVLIAVSDTGSWRPRREDDQGRGLVLMRALMDDVDVVRSEEGTTVTMRRALLRTRTG
jgi:PAS domain S-box-containing protein